MLAASYWSLLAPAIEIAEESGLYGSLTFLPISFGFLTGALFVYMADLLLPLLVGYWWGGGLLGNSVYMADLLLGGY